ncbi:MAG: hypothetical protein MK160_08790, partial [Rhodobacteraceae bacterium]|nr:hypothetical protein [Paracoccaceae bacterium]
MADTFFTLAEETAIHDPKPWCLRPDDWPGHVLVVGAEGASKRGLLLNAMAQAIASGAGVAELDPNGRYAKRLLDLVPSERLNDTYLFQPQHTNKVVGYNPFALLPEKQRSRAAQDTMEVFKLVWGLDHTSHPLMLALLQSAARVL